MRGRRLLPLRATSLALVCATGQLGPAVHSRRESMGLVPGPQSGDTTAPF